MRLRPASLPFLGLKTFRRGDDFHSFAGLDDHVHPVCMGEFNGFLFDNRASDRSDKTSFVTPCIGILPEFFDSLDLFEDIRCF